MATFPYYNSLLPETESLLRYLEIYEILESHPRDIHLGTDERILGALRGLASRRRMLFVSFVVSLYGAFEEFVESLAERYVDFHVNIAKLYKVRVEEKIRESHFSRSLDRLNRRDFRQDLGVSVSDVLRGMLDGYDADGHHISGEIFRVHTSNFRVESIEALFSELGCQNIIKSVCSCDWVKENLFQGDRCGDDPDDASTLKRARLMLSNFVEARNRAAHGKLRDIEGRSTMESWLRLVRVLGFYLERLVLDELGRFCILKNRAQKVECVSVYKDGRVLILTGGTDTTVDESSLVIAKRGTFPILRWAPVQEIQRDGNRVQSLRLGDGCEAGVKVGFRGRKDYEYFVVRSQDWQSVGLPIENMEEDPSVPASISHEG